MVDEVISIFPDGVDSLFATGSSRNLRIITAGSMGGGTSMKFSDQKTSNDGNLISNLRARIADSSYR